MSGQHCENYDVKQETVHCYPRNVDRCCTSFDNNVIICFHQFDAFALLYHKSLNERSLGEQWILFPLNLNVSRDEVEGNIEIQGKQNSLFPSGPVTKCLLLTGWNLKLSDERSRGASVEYILERRLAFAEQLLQTIVLILLPCIVSISNFAYP